MPFVFFVIVIIHLSNICMTKLQIRIAYRITWVSWLVYSQCKICTLFFCGMLKWLLYLVNWSYGYGIHSVRVQLNNRKQKLMIIQALNFRIKILLTVAQGHKLQGCGVIKWNGLIKGKPNEILTQKISHVSEHHKIFHSMSYQLCHETPLINFKCLFF